METDIVTLIANYGVPAGICVYLVLWITRKLNNKLDKLTESINTLNNKFDTLIRIIDREETRD